MSQDSIAEMYNLCAKDPDAGLATVRRKTRESGESEADPLTQFADAMALAAKGLGPTGAPGSAFVELSEQQLDCLESALRKIREIEETAPGHLRTFLSDDLKPCREAVNRLTAVLEKRRHGKVAVVLGPIKPKFDFCFSEAPLEEKLVGFGTLCQSDPDAGLAMSRWISPERSPDVPFKPDEVAEQMLVLGPDHVAFEPLLYIGRFLAYAEKGLAQRLRQNPMRGLLSADAGEVRDHLGLTEEDLGFLEAALREMRQLEYISRPLAWQENDFLEKKVDVVAKVLDKLRPGRTQEILGKTKLFYFQGSDRLKVLPDIDQKSARPLLGVFFSTEKIARSAVVAMQGHDSQGRAYLYCMLFQGSFDDLGPDDALGAAGDAGHLYLFDDGTFSTELEETEESPQEGPELREKPPPASAAAATTVSEDSHEAAATMPPAVATPPAVTPPHETSVLHAVTESAGPATRAVVEDIAQIGDAGRELVEHLARGRAALASLEEVVGALKQLQNDRARALEHLQGSKALLRLLGAVACLAIAVVGLAWTGHGLLAFLGLPVALGLAVVLFRLDHMVWMTEKFQAWVERKRSREPPSSGWLRKIFVSAYLSGFNAIGQWTGGVRNMYARTGVRCPASLYWAGIVLIFNIVVVWVGVSLSCIVVPLVIYHLATSKKE